MQGPKSGLAVLLSLPRTVDRIRHLRLHIHGLSCFVVRGKFGRYVHEWHGVDGDVVGWERLLEVEASELQGQES